MECVVEVVSIEEEYAVVALDQKTWNMPLAILPAHSRPGDILQIQVGFCPFRTLAHIK
ncbi:MAG: hypothetical protein ACOX25_01565 [Caldicoprobacterales bacterium]|jgi:hypothetical protein|nr:hypothetical protein [Clostridiales bacterium]